MADVSDHAYASAAGQAKVAFVIPVRNDADRLRTCLRGLLASAGDTPHDLLVMDHGSTDDTATVARDLGARVVTVRGGNVAALRNAGAAATTAPFIAFIDADNEVGCEWTVAGLSAVGDGVGMAGAAYRAPSPGTWVQRTYDALRRHATRVEPTEWLAAGNMLVRREAFLTAGGFDDTLETCEDVDLCNRIAQAGWQVLAVPGMTSVHHGDPETLSRVFWGEMWRGRDNVRVTLRGPRSWRTLLSAAVPIAYALALAGLVVAPFLGAWFVAIAGGVGVSLLLVARLLAMRQNAGGRWPDGLAAAIAVALAYDLGRSLAVVARVGHGRRQGSKA